MTSVEIVHKHFVQQIFFWINPNTCFFWPWHSLNCAKMQLGGNSKPQVDGQFSRKLWKQNGPLSQSSRVLVCKSISHQVMFYYHGYCLLCLLPFALRFPGIHPHSPPFGKFKRIINRFFSLVPYLIKPLESPLCTPQNINLYA